LNILGDLADTGKSLTLRRKAGDRKEWQKLKRLEALFPSEIVDYCLLLMTLVLHLCSACNRRTINFYMMMMMIMMKRAESHIRASQ